MQYYRNRNTDELVMAERHDIGSTPGYYVYYQSGAEGMWYAEELFNATYRPYETISGTLENHSTES